MQTLPQHSTFPHLFFPSPLCLAPILRRVGLASGSGSDNFGGSGATAGGSGVYRYLARNAIAGSVAIGAHISNEFKFMYLPTSFSRLWSRERKSEI